MGLGLTTLSAKRLSSSGVACVLGAACAVIRAEK